MGKFGKKFQKNEDEKVRHVEKAVYKLELAYYCIVN